ncbi:hypothetical protein AU188_19245 [Mycobacterium sp. IS-3022]|nr:hypothetical protein AU188_19245 [Mycobacterium sp. IS-3022]
MALGVGFAVATTPGLALAEEGSAAGARGEETSSVDTKSADAEPATESGDEGNDGGGDPGARDEQTNTTSTTTTTGNQSTTVIGGGGSPQVTISGSTITSSGTSTQQTLESSAPTATADATPTPVVEATGTPKTPSYTPPEPTPTPNVAPAPQPSTVPESDPHPSTAPGGLNSLIAGEGDLTADEGGNRTSTTIFTALDSTDPDAGQFGMRMSVGNGLDETQKTMAADLPTGLNTLDAPAPAPAVTPPDPFEAIMVFTGSIISQVVNAVTAALAPIFGPGAPLYNSVIWGAIEAVRRQTNQAWSNSTPVVDLQTSGQQDADDREIHGTLGGFDADGDALTYSVPTSGVGAPTNGAVTINAAAGTWTYKPNLGYSGPDSFTIIASDSVAGYHIHGTGQSHTGSDTITVSVAPTVPPNRAPVANADALSVDEDTTLSTGNVLANDTDADGDTKQAVLVSGPADAVPGSFVLNSDGTFTYTPKANFNGSDSFTYKVNDGNLDSGTVTASITVRPVNDAPVAVDDAGFSTDKTRALTIQGATLTANDTDIDGGALVVTAVSNAQGGTVAVTNGVIKFSPDANYTGPASFAYTVSDGAGGVAHATATIEVTEFSGGSTGAVDVGSSAKDLTVVGDRLYVAKWFANTTVAVVDLNTNTVVDTDAGTPGRQDIQVGPTPHGVAVVGNRLYVTHYSSRNTVTVVDLDTYTAIDLDPDTPGRQDITIEGLEGAYLIAVEDRLYVSHGFDGAVSVIDTSTNTVTESVSTGGSYPAAMALDGTRLYVANFGTDTVAVIDTTSNTLVDMDPDISGDQNIGGAGIDQPRGIAVANNKLYVANGNGTVSVIDLTTNTPVDANPDLEGIQPISSGGGDFAFLADIAVSGDRIYVSDVNNTRVLVIDTSTDTVVDVIGTTHSPWDLAVAGDRLYVASGTGIVRIFDIAGDVT